MRSSAGFTVVSRLPEDYPGSLAVGWSLCHMDAHSGLIASIRKGTPQDATAFQMALRRVASTGLDIASTYRGLWEGREATEAMLSRLASRMRWGSYQWPSGPGGWHEL